MKPVRGDVLLYESTGKWYERLIVFATGGPYVHCSIVVDTRSHIIEATPAGIHTGLIERATYAIINTQQYTTSEGMTRGLSWAIQQQGKQYGWLDVIYQAIKFLWPNNPFRFGQIDHYDCSDFCTRYLMHTGIILPDDFDDPYTDTPNDIGRLFGYVSPRKGHTIENIQKVT